MSDGSSTNEPQTESSSGCPLHSLMNWKATESKGSRLLILGFGLVAYVAFFAVILYSIGFVAGVVVPKDIDGGTAGELVPSLVINGLMLSVFVVQHTIMARPRFKLWLAKLLPIAVERSIFVLLSSVILAGTYWLWRPLPEVVWSVENAMAVNVIYGIAAIGWVIVFASTFMINHFDLFGLRQVMMNASGKDYHPLPFQKIWLYRFVRHPLMFGFILAFWAAPVMSVGHLFFAIMTTGYIVFGTWIEERDLVAAFGDGYRDYQREVRGLVPLPRMTKK